MWGNWWDILEAAPLLRYVLDHKIFFDCYCSCDKQEMLATRNGDAQTKAALKSREALEHKLHAALSGGAWRMGAALPRSPHWHQMNALVLLGAFLCRLPLKMPLLSSQRKKKFLAQSLSFLIGLSWGGDYIWLEMFFLPLLHPIKV